jgi:hypothetical protein
MFACACEIKPIRHILPACCAPAATGHVAAAPPSSVKKSRRLNEQPASGVSALESGAQKRLITTVLGVTLASRCCVGVWERW